MHKTKQEKRTTYWRSQPPTPFHDVSLRPGHDPHPMFSSITTAPKHKILDLRPGTENSSTLTYLSPVVQAKNAATLWDSFQVSSHTRSLPFVQALPITTTSPVIEQAGSGLPIEKPHAIALGLALLLISLGILSFKL